MAASLTGARVTLCSVAGLNARFESKLEEGFAFDLPASFLPFEIAAGTCDVEVALASRRELPQVAAKTLHESRVNWRIQEFESGRVFEVYHPPSGRIYCRAFVSGTYRDWKVLLRQETSPLSMPHPLDQLIWIPPVAEAGGVFLHACGAVLDGRALVFAGHSGDGKTTLARILEGEGLSILSDERIALRRDEEGYRAYGTPWPGAGEKVSSAAHPLGALFVLRKAVEHRIVEAPRHALAGEIVARSIVPYYLPEVADDVLATLARLLSEIPLYELHFARAPGVASILAEAFP